MCPHMPTWVNRLTSSPPDAATPHPFSGSNGLQAGLLLASLGAQAARCQWGKASYKLGIALGRQENGRKLHTPSIPAAFLPF